MPTCFYVFESELDLIEASRKKLEDMMEGEKIRNEDEILPKCTFVQHVVHTTRRAHLPVIRPYKERLNGDGRQAHFPF